MECTQWRRQLFLELAIAFYIVCIYHSQKTMQFESEVQLLPENNVSMHVRFRRMCRFILPESSQMTTQVMPVVLKKKKSYVFEAAF